MEQVLKNKEFDLEFEVYNFENEVLKFITKKDKSTYFEQLRRVIKQPHAQNGIGDLEEQRIRLGLLGMLEAAVSDKKEEIKIPETDARFLAKNMDNVKDFVLSKGLTDFRTIISNWNK